MMLDHMPKRGSVETAAGRGLIQKLLQENEFDYKFSKILLDVFISVCRTLEVSDPADPLSNTIARTVILIASEGERDPDELYKRTVNRLSRNS